MSAFVCSPIRECPGAVVAFVLGCLAAAAWATDSDQVKRLFTDPPREYSSAPLWVWNDMLTEEQVVQTMRDLAGQQVKQVFVHPRPGLMTPYLGEEWFHLWGVALREAERLDMNVWIYDENSYPSGFAGGIVPEEMPESRGRGLGMREEKQAPKWTDDLVEVFRWDGVQVESVTAKVKAGQTLPDATYLVFSLLRAKDSPWHGGRCYVDLMYPGVTEKFIDVTLEAYKRHIGDQFGQRVPGTFTDEPELVPAGGLPWTEGLPAAFQQRWGYDLLDHLPSLYRKVGDWKRVRHNYYQVVLEQFIEHWAKPMYDWCERNKLEFTGHYWEHEWPRARYGPDHMAMYAFHQRPAIDILMNQYSEDVHAQFGNVRAVKELASVANQFGRRTLCEAYGAAGWDSRFEDYKRIGDWLYVLGVNTLDQHLSYVSLRGARKRDHPQSFSYHEPWWEAYHTQAQYFARLSAALSAGEEVNDILVIEPTTAAWMYNAEGADDPQLKRLGDDFQALVTRLAKARCHYDIGSEELIGRYGRVDKNGLRIGNALYRILVLPPGLENLNSATAALIEKGLGNGVYVYTCQDEPPSRVDGQTSDRVVKSGRGECWVVSNPGKLVDQLVATGGTFVKLDKDSTGIVFQHRRRLSDGHIVFLANTSLESPVAGSLRIEGKRAERLDPWTGRIVPYPFRPGSGTESAEGATLVMWGVATFDLAPGASLLLLISDADGPPVPERRERSALLALVGGPQLRRAGPNVLTLDYVDVTAGGETKRDSYFYAAGQFVWQKNGLERNPWDSAVQFKDELISHKFPTESGFEATYRFNIEGRVPADLAIVIERPDLYTVACNGQPAAAKPGQWWLDRQFGVIDIAKAARVGANEVTIKASPMTMFHELEPAYVLGDFDLKAAERGFVIVPPAALKLGKWNEQGLPFYATGVTYTQKFDVAPAGANGSRRHVVTLPAWYGAVAKVVVNGKPAGYIGSQPYECDVTSAVVVGPNVIEVTVIGTLKNTLGPHHGKPPLGTAWPAMWRKAPESGPPAGADYSTVGYGLFAPFELHELTP